MKKTLTALSFISVAAFSAYSVAGPGEMEYTYRNGEKIRVVSPEAQTSLFEDTSGKPVLEINSPNNRGISHNIFEEYNVGRKGLTIINNDNATTIINEVIGDKVTNLWGNTHISGGKANLLIVNPNGVNCRGCSSTGTTIYTHRKTLPSLVNSLNKTKIFTRMTPAKASDRLTDIRHNISFSVQK
ncbi:filamentous hemagglutinin N-terminal domain-containing protein [Morganella psychrotolerans]|uniref:Large exoprotein n=1 Tax=Morganella psychrotolerans TaxID=368603 RepID=A0A1B8HUG6_9GAMM|nr:filamentous hemagglutinin N-terminal domain-containing protein [Morganella psychrotolerans]OBU13411.1 large exoprotein [Morganella psychrotolerans]